MGLTNNEDINYVSPDQLKQIMLSTIDKVDKRYLKKDDYKPETFFAADAAGALASKDNVGLEDLDPVLAATIESKVDEADVITQENVDAAVQTALEPLGDLALLDTVTEEDLSEGLKNKINDVYTKAEVYTKDDVYTQNEVNTIINNKLGSVYKFAGTCTFDELPELTAENVGKVYNVTEHFTSTEDFVDGADIDYPMGSNVAVSEVEDGVYKYDVLAGLVDLSGYVKFEDIVVASSEQINDIIDSIYPGMDTNEDPAVVDFVLASGTSFAEIGKAFNDENVTTVNAKLNQDIVVPTRSDGKISTTFINAGQTVNLDLNGHNVSCDAYMLYVNGGNLVISDSTGTGTITTRIENQTYPAIQVQSGSVTMEGGVIDCTAEPSEGNHNWTYGIVCANDAVFRMTGGTIKTTDASCISITNGTAAAAGAKFIIGGDAHLITTEGPAIYLADNKDVIIKDDAVVEGGIVARMGNVEIKGNGYVINNLTEEYGITGFGDYLRKSGTHGTPAGIMGLAGCYKTNTESNDLDITVSENGKVESVLGEAIGIAKLDTLYTQAVTVTVEDESALVPAAGSDKIKVYSHDELAEIAAAEGVTLANKAVDTTVVVTVNGVITYNDTPVPEPEPEEPETPNEPEQPEESEPQEPENPEEPTPNEPEEPENTTDGE